MLRNKSSEYLFLAVCLTVLTGTVLFLLVLMADLILDGVSRLDYQFLTSFPSRRAARAGIAPALVGSVYLMILVALISLPLGVGAAIYLEEYAPKTWFSRMIELNIANLAGVPSVVYGILGLQIFVRYFKLDRSLLAGALTMSLLILPIIILTSRESIKRVPESIRDGARALGASKWAVVQDHVLPLASPGIFTGCILAFSRAIGETAPLVIMGALTYVAYLPDSVMSEFTVLPIQAFNWISRPKVAFHVNAAAAILVLLTMLLTMNAVAVLLRNKFETKLEL